MRYLKSTPDEGIILKPDKTQGLTCYVDADYAGEWTVDRALAHAFLELDMWSFMQIVPLCGPPNYKRLSHCRRLRPNMLPCQRL